MSARPTRTLAVVSAGLSQPSSTRLLADRLADGVRTAGAEPIRPRSCVAGVATTERLMCQAMNRLIA